MSQALLLFIVLICVGPSLQQLQTLKDPEFVAAGRTITLSCRYDSGNLGDGNYPWWSQQIPGHQPRSLIYQTSSRPSGVPERFSGSRSGNVMSLTITGALVEDEATYYCCVWTGSQYVFGGGTQLTVTGQPPVSPSLQVFAPPEQQIKSEKKATLVCLLSGFYPPTFTLKWKVDDAETTSGVETTKATKQGDKYLASSYLTRSDSDYGDHNYVCEVVHNGNTFSKSVSGSGGC